MHRAPGKLIYKSWGGPRVARLRRREAKQKGFSGVPERGGGPNGDSRVSFQGRKLLHLLPSVLNHSQPWEKSSWSQPSFSIPKLPRGLPRTQVASFLGLAGRRPLPPRMLPPQETPPDSASFTPILPPSGPGWGSGPRRPLPHSLGVRRMRGWAGGGESRLLHGACLSAGWELKTGSPQGAPSTRRSLRASTPGRRVPAVRFQGNERPLLGSAHSPCRLTNPRLEFKIPAAPLTPHSLPLAFLIFFPSSFFNFHSG